MAESLREFRICHSCSRAATAHIGDLIDKRRTPDKIQELTFVSQHLLDVGYYPSCDPPPPSPKAGQSHGNLPWHGAHVSVSAQTNFVSPVKEFQEQV